MLKPSYAELMDVLNENADEDQSKVTSRYTVVIAAAKRARQIIDGDEPMVASPDGKPVSAAVEELREGKIKIVPEGEGTELGIYKQRELKRLDEERKKQMFAELEKMKLNMNDNESDVNAEGFDETDDFDEDDDLDIDDLNDEVNEVLDDDLYGDAPDDEADTMESDDEE